MTPDCPNNCTHTRTQHAAFDAGLRDGEHGQYQNIYITAACRFAYESGYSVGELNREAGK